MALATYSDLKSAVIKYAMRDGDADFEAEVPNHIALGESRLNRELPLRVMEVDATLTGTAGSRTISLPDDYVEPYALHIVVDGFSTELKPVLAGEIELSPSQGRPGKWCINGENIELDAPCDQAYSFRFRYRKSFKLTDSSPTNWLLTNHPDVYLAASLVWGNIFMLAPEMAAPWKQILDEAIQEIGWKESRSQISTLSVDPALSARGGFNIHTG